MATLAEPLEFNPYSYAVHDDPFPFYRRLRDEAPAYRNDDLGFWALSRYDDVVKRLHDPETYSSASGIALEDITNESRKPLPLLIMRDPPEHGPMRRILARGFTPRRIAEMEPRVRDLATRYVDEIIERGSCDFIEDFAAKLPMDVISHLLDVPRDDWDQLREWTDLLLEREEGKPDITPVVEEAAGKIIDYFFVDLAHRKKNPGDDITSQLLRAEVEGRKLTDLEIVAFSFLFIIAGNETTTKLLGNTVYWLTKFRDQRQLIIDDPTLIPDGVEESLRFEGSTQLMARTLTRDVELHGQQMSDGDPVLLLLGSANRDERAWRDPDRFDVTRDRQGVQLALGHGVHVCLGASLARLEMKVCLEELHRRMPDYEVDLDGCQRIHAGNVRGYASVPMSFTPGPREGAEDIGATMEP